nr:biotin--[acetyl-CoA-carboxylase] ligase [Salirhabdus salicampi]
MITLLSQKDNQYISGQVLSNELQISRSAVWKHMKELEKDGYIIEAVTRKGYRIVKHPDKISGNTLQWGLETNWLGQSLTFEEQTESTQTIAHQLAQQGAIHGSVVVADEQLEGRGRLNRPWHSEKGSGIWMSMILRPEIQPHKAPQLTLLTAVAIVETLKKVCKIEPKIKWPNDIFIHDRKLAGILTEMQAETDQIQYVIIGLGLNVNHRSDDLPEALQNIASSIHIETGKQWPRAHIIQRFLVELEGLYEHFIQHGFAKIKEMWLANAYKIGEQITVHTRNKAWEGILLGIQDDGALRVEEVENKEQHILYSAEIEWHKRRDEE